MEATKLGVSYEIVGGDYGPERVLFANLAEAEASVAHLCDEFPDTDWDIIYADVPYDGHADGNRRARAMDAGRY